MKKPKPETEPEMTPEGMTRWVASEFSKTGKFVRINDEQWSVLMESNMIESLRGGSWVGLGTSDLTAVSRKAFANNFHVDVSTVAKWVTKGLPVLEDGTIPLHCADHWVNRYQEKIREA